MGWKDWMLGGYEVGKVASGLSELGDRRIMFFSEALISDLYIIVQS